MSRLNQQCVMKRERGATLLEVLMMVSVASLLITGLVSSTINSVGTARANRVRGQAVRFASEGMELVRGERDKAWQPFSNKSGNVVYSTLGYARKGIAVNLTGKRTENFSMRANPFPDLNRFDRLN